MAQLRDTIVSGSLRATDTLYSTTAQFSILRAPTTSGGTTFGPGTSGHILTSNGTSAYWAQSFEGNAASATRLNISSTDDAIARFDGVNGLVQNSTAKITDGGTLIINPGNTNGYTEGIRINKANSGWAILHIGGASGSVSGTEDGAWTIGRRGTTGSKVTAAVGDLTIEEQESTGSGLTIHKDSGGMTLYTNKTNGDGFKITNAGTIAANTSFIPIRAMSENMAASSWTLINIGKAASNKNSATFGFGYAGNASDDNYVTIGLHSQDNLLIIKANGNVGIGTTSPSTKLQVNGTVTATAFSGPLTGNVTGTLSTTRITLPGITGTGTTGADQGSSNTSTRYKPAVWTFNAGIAPVDGDIITIKQPCAGHDYGTWLTLDNGTTYHPVVYNASDRITTHFTNGTSVTLCYDANGTASVLAIGGAMSRTTVTGVWRVWNTYNTNNNDTGYYILSNGFRLTAGTTYKLWRYGLFARTSDGIYESFTNTSGTATTKVKNPHGFLPEGKIYWNSASSTDYSGTTNLSAYEQYHSIDYRYTFNISTTGIPASAYTYIKWTYNTSDGLLYLADEWFATSLPISADGFIYQRIGSNYYGSADYRGSLLLNNPYYFYDNGIKLWYPTNATLIKSALGTVSTSAQKFLKDTGTWEQVAWGDITSKPLTLTAAATGFTIAGGTTSKTLTVSENATLKGGSSTYLAYYSASNTISGHSYAHFSDTYSSSTKNGKNELVLGNATASTSNGSAYGQLALYSSGTKGTYLATAANSTEWYTATLPAASGTIAYTSSDITGNAATATSATKDSAGNVIKDTYLKLSGGTLTGNLIFNRVSNTPMIRFNNAKGGSERNASITINDTNNNLQFWQYGPNNTSNSNANNAECYRLPAPDDNTESAIYDIFTTKNFSCNFKHISTFSASSNSNKKIYGNHVLVFYYYGNSCYGIVSFWNTGSNQYLQTYLQTGSYVTVTSGYTTNNTTNENHYYIQIANTASSGTVRGYYFSDEINS